MFSSFLFRWRAVVVFLLGMLLGAQALAGRSCEQHHLAPREFIKALDLAARTAKALDDNGAQVVLLARAGQDLRKWGLHYSHAAWAYRASDQTWRVVHKLNQCGSAVSNLYRQGLAEFFLDDLWQYEAAWIVPTKEVQQRLHPVVATNALLLKLHEPSYSLVSYAWASKHQQSNQWALELLAATIMHPGTPADREQAQRWLRQQAYLPANLKIGALTRLGGQLSAANVVFDDHPLAQRIRGDIQTISVDSIFEWMRRAHLSDQDVVQLRLAQ